VGPAEGIPVLWLKFLDRIFDGDEQLIGFVQRLLGYCLTGVTTEHAMAFCYGTGRNGKNTLLDAVAAILADYHSVVPMETLLASRHEGHPTDVAGLAGCRMATGGELDKGRRWAEAKIKHLTGGGKVKARFMRGDFFEFVPAFKLVVAGNHKPALNTVDEAIRARFNLIPFTVTIPVPERDKELPEKLKAEWPQILQWMVDGCVEWQEHGLAAPASVKAATDEYLSSQDSLANWLDECTEEAAVETKSSVLYGSWKTWCEDNGEVPGSRKAFTQSLRDTLRVPGRDTLKGGWLFRRRMLSEVG
jgi:putative DNA primase/helicase